MTLTASFSVYTYTTGRQLLDTFSMTASSWSDQDLPLQYAFGYTSARGLLVMQPMSQTAFISAPLPAGQDTNGFNITCQAQVFDSYLAYSRINATVTVTKVALKSSALLSLGNKLSLIIYAYSACLISQ